MFIKKLGFTMIELLVVIAVIGILAVALLSTLNPLEQIRKGRDTRTRADLSQLLGGIERYNASLGYFPWQASEGEDLVPGAPDVDFVQINGGTLDDALDELTSTSEVKSSFIDRVTGVSYADTYLFYDDETTGGSVIACFTPESQSFQREAYDRCAAGVTAWASDFNASGNIYSGAGKVCPDGDASTYTPGGFDATSTDEMICLP